MAIQQIVGMDGDGLISLIQERIGYRLVGFQFLIIDQLYLLIFDGIHMTFWWTSWTKTPSFYGLKMVPHTLYLIWNLKMGLLILVLNIVFKWGSMLNFEN